MSLVNASISISLSHDFVCLFTMIKPGIRNEGKKSA
jgi:hypothetical protein